MSALTAIMATPNTPDISTTSNTTSKDFSFPSIYTFPPFFTLQPIVATQTAQLQSWSSLLQTYCAHHKLFSLTPTASIFTNSTLHRTLDSVTAVPTLVAYMSSPEGGQRAEWKDGVVGGAFWVWWKRPEEWAGVVEAWVEGTGQKGSVLTVWELVNGEAAAGEPFHGMEEELMKRCLQVLVKRGKVQVFGSENQLGVKFF